MRVVATIYDKEKYDFVSMLFKRHSNNGEWKPNEVHRVSALNTINIRQNNTNSDFPVAIIVEDTIEQCSFPAPEEAC